MFIRLLLCAGFFSLLMISCQSKQQELLQLNQEHQLADAYKLWRSSLAYMDEKVVLENQAFLDCSFTEWCIAEEFPVFLNLVDSISTWHIVDHPTTENLQKAEDYLGEIQRALKTGFSEPSLLE